MAHGPPRHCQRHDRAAAFDDRLAVFNAENIVRIFEHGGVLADERPCRRLARACKGCARRERFAQRRRKIRAQQRFRRAQQHLRLAALAAKGQHADKPRCIQDRNAAARKALRRCDGPRQRQLQHKIRAAAHRRFRARVRALDSKIAALDKASAHRADDACIRAEAPPQLVELPFVAVVEGIILCYYTNCVHESPLKAVTKELRFVKFACV